MIARYKPIKRSTKPLKRSRISPVSKKRGKEMRTYGKLRKEFLEAHPWCQVQLQELGILEVATSGWDKNLPSYVAPACDIHHMAGRTGSNYLDTSTWLAVSREAHRRIHENPSWAREMGFLK